MVNINQMESMIIFLLGGAVGAFVNWWSEQSQDIMRQIRARDSFFTSLFSMLGKIAKADGVVTEPTIKLINNFIENSLQLDNEARRRVITVFNQAKDSSLPFDEYAKKFLHSINQLPEFNERKSETLLNIVGLLLQISSTNHQYSVKQEQMILSAVEIFGINHDLYQQIKTGYYPTFQDHTKYYQILGCTPGDSIEDIKKKYRRLVQDYHPDKVLSKGLAPEFVTFANKKFQEIQCAYEAIKQERN